jgi:hypothetical protein
MDVEIGGPLRFRLQPGLLVTLADVHVHNRGRNVGSASVISLGIDLLSLFAGNVRIRSIALHDVSLFIERDLDGSLNVGTGKDVAGATNENRIALKGRVDLVNEEFVGLSMALIDPNGCVKVEQKIRGTFNQPIMEQPNVLGSFFRPALELLRKGVELISGNDECEAFYTGSVTPPR